MVYTESMEKTKTPKTPKRIIPPAPKLTHEELAESTILLTHTGSRLYGLAHAGSDEDFYRIVPEELYWKAIGRYPSGEPKFKSQQHINNGIDELTLSFKTFIQYAYMGAPQALEAMFSQMPTIDKLEAFRKDYFAGMNGDSMKTRYRSSIKLFAHGGIKHRRHALRMSLNLDEALRSGGRFNPTLTPATAAEISAIATSTPDEFLAAIENINHYEIISEFNRSQIEDNFIQNTP